MSTGELTFVSVVFEAELMFLQLQARSMAAFLPESGVAEILVIDNSARGIPAAERSRLLSEYGPLSGRVRVLRPLDICTVPGTVGWRSQQVLKLCIAAQITTDRYVVLDAKNIFVHRPGPDFFCSADGRPTAKAYSYQSHPLRPALEHVLEYLGLDPADHIDRFTATITPFVLETALVRAMVGDVVRRSGSDFPTEFVKHDLTEFFLYSGWLVADGRSLEDVFDLEQLPCPNVWPSQANLGSIERAISSAESAEMPPLFTVHRKALARLDRASVAAVARFWASRGLFTSVAEAEAFITDFRRVFDREDRVRRLREIPHKLTALSRRIVPSSR